MQNIRKSDGFTLIELLVVIVIIAILAAIIFPALTAARGAARQKQCLANTKQISVAIILYADDNDGWIVKSANPPPRWATWAHILSPYFKGSGIHLCPIRARPPFKNNDSVHWAWGIGLNHPSICGYWDNERKKLSEVRRPSRTVVGGDSGRIMNPSAEPDEWIEGSPSWIFRTPSNEPYYSDYRRGFANRIIGRHNGRVNAIFLDGHARSVNVSDLGFQYPEKHPLAMWDIY